MSKQEPLRQVRTRYIRAVETLDERGRRAASDALALGWDGVTVVARATGLSRATIWLGIKELRGAVASAPTGPMCRLGGGRVRLAAGRVAVKHFLAHIGQWRGDHARYLGLRKNLYDVRRTAVVSNLHDLLRLPDVAAAA